MNNRIKLIDCLVAFTLIGLLVLSGCKSSSESPPTKISQIKTKIFYLDRSMLPPDSELTVVLEEVSNNDTSGTIISSKSITVNTAPPYQVILEYDKALVKQTASYVVRAEIKKAGKLLYYSDTNQYSFRDEKESFEIRVLKVVSPPIPDVTLNNTYWKAITLNGHSVKTPEGSREAFLQLRQNNQIRGFSGCNVFNGEYTINDSGLYFNNLASTMKLCVQEANILETAMNTVLVDTVKYKIKGESLTLYNQSNKPIALFQAVYF